MKEADSGGGGGTSSPYARADFDGQRRKTRTVARDLNPAWNEALEFDFPPAGVDPVEGEPLEVAVLHDLRVGPTRRSNFLGRVRLDARQFVRRGEEALIYFPLKKEKGFLNSFNWVRGDIGLNLKVYYVDVPLAPTEPEPPAAGNDAAPPDAAAAESEAAAPPPDAAATASTDEPPKAEEPMDAAAPAPQPEAAEASAGDGATTEKPPEADPAPATPEDAPVMTAEAVAASEERPPEEEPVSTPPPQPTPTPMPRQASMPVRQLPPLTPMPRQVSMPVRQLQPPPPQLDEPMVQSKHDLVDKMPYLFVRVVRARGLPAGAHPHVRVAAGGHQASTREARRGAFFEWDQTFAFVRDPATDSPGPTLEVSVWDLPPDADVSVADDRHFLGGLCFDTADVHAGDPPDGPLATLWYRLEGGRRLGGADLMVATWAGTQADEAFADAWKADSPSAPTATAAATSRAKVYASPKLWHLRLTVIEAQDTLTAPPPRDAGIAVRGTLGFQALKTRTTPVARNGGPSWNEDLLFVAAEPFTDDDCLVISLEVRHGKEVFPVGSASISLATVERRVDDRKVASKWIDLLPSDEATKRVGKKAPRAPAPHPCVRASMAEAPDREELDEEFDTIPSARPPEVVRARYDRDRMVGARLQQMVGDVATQAERLQALVSWRDPRATGLFVALCVLVAMVLYMVPMKMVAVVAGFYYLRHPMFRDRMPATVINFFRRLPSMSERIMQGQAISGNGVSVWHTRLKIVAMN
ncbi:unnamed protein product [Miscanthus lutarioriparius]|uniref:C2 domain-containing protein n=1 Tax=Miscanthus lutarioriparius TaxID=422564 RepID=A0A811NEU6_9POAL|nr:unnamed protein product [Miscanthus lutarioriparius]